MLTLINILVHQISCFVSQGIRTDLALAYSKPVIPLHSVYGNIPISEL